MQSVRFPPRWLASCLAFVALVACVFSMPNPVYATPSVGSGFTSTTAIINRIINTTPGLNAITTTGSGIAVSAAADTAVVARGVTIPISATAATTMTAGRLAGIAAAGLKVGSWVGIASVVAPWVLAQSGYKVCPAPDFFCKASVVNVAPNETNKGYWADYGGTPFWGKDGQTACDNYYAGYPYSSKTAWGGLKYIDYVHDGLVGQCLHKSDNAFQTNVGYQSGTCPAGSTKTAAPGGAYVCTAPGPDVAVSESELGASTEAAITNNPTRLQFLYGGLGTANAPMFAPSDPVTVTPTKTTFSAPVETTTNTVPKADGSIDTVKVTTSTDVKPVVSGTTLGDTKIDYPTTITTTTTTTNNVTNNTTTNTTITNTYATPATKTTDNTPDRPPTPIPKTADEAAAASNQIPTDYNREVTQKSVLAELQKLNAPITATAPTGDSDLASIKAKNDEGTTAIGGVTESSTGWKAWLPSIKTAACVNPQVPIPITGGMLAVPICDAVNTFAAFVSAVISVFALYGCIREVQLAVKA